MTSWWSVYVLSVCQLLFEYWKNMFMSEKMGYLMLKLMCSKLLSQDYWDLLFCFMIKLESLWLILTKSLAYKRNGVFLVLNPFPFVLSLLTIDHELVILLVCLLCKLVYLKSCLVGNSLWNAFPMVWVYKHACLNEEWVS